MSTPRPTPCGAWPSPLTPELAAAGAISLNCAAAAHGTLYWIEGRPAERGRCVLMARLPSGSVVEVLGADANVRSRVHEYGGTPWAAVGERLVYAEFDDQRLRMRTADGCVALTPPGCRYADGIGAPDGRTLVCVREDHRAPGEPANSIVAIDLDEPDEGRVLFGESDFVAWPRVDRTGRRLAFVAWDHPAMPWDGTRLVVGEMSDGKLVQSRVVAGGPGEAVLEPQWGSDGSLYFLSDRTGWWNLYRWRDGVVEPMTSLDAEIGGPLWMLGMRSYALAGDERVLLSVSRDTTETLCVLDLPTRELRSLDLPFVAFSSLGMLDTSTAFAIASPVDDLPALISVDLSTGAYELVRRAGTAPIAPEVVSRPQAIAFPTAPGPDGERRSAHAWFYPPCLPGHQPPAGEAPPLMVMLHGGPTSCALSAFKVGVQFWTSRGFAVVDVNYGGSSGYGRAYRERLKGQWGVVDLQDAVAAVDFLVGAGRVDGRRVAIRGGSAGGFTVLSALAFTDRFAAGINYFGVADLEALASDTHKFESRYLDSLVAPLPAGRDVYRARSPALHMANCRAALITFQGSEDKAVPPQQSRAIVAAARAAGCLVAYVEFEGEGHGFRQGPNIIRALQAELVFLGRVFRFTPHGELPLIELENESAD
jgi:dipeptidyl aminopeptidase/acylaminoacyl peptidase